MNCNNFNNNSCGNVPLMIHKTNSVSGAAVPGAVFELVSCNGFTCRGTTDTNGSLVFSVFPCNSYMLREVGVPPGYAPIDHVYNICVDPCGCIFVDDVLISKLMILNTPVSISAPPTINTVFEGDIVITGTGVPGAAIVATLPNGSAVSAIVSANGIWLVNVPVGVNLVAGDVVSAAQTEPGKLPSSQVSVTVAP